MARWMLLLAVVVASTTASADPTPAVPTIAVTDHAQATATAAERRVAELAAQRAALAQRYQDELDAIDHMKRQRQSWRRDRDLRDRMSKSLETANQLTATSIELDKARLGLVIARRAYLTAIDGELASGPARPRRAALESAKKVLEPQLADAPRRIVVPNLDVDFLADPEELDQRASELRATEDELARQIAVLDAQTAELEHLAQVRKQHDRANEMFNRDDDQPHRTARVAEAGPSASSAPAESGKPLSQPGSSSSSGESYLPIVLADVIDAATINSFTAAERSGDPARRVEAARRTHDAVVKRVEQLRKKRVEIEARARQLRTPH